MYSNNSKEGTTTLCGIASDNTHIHTHTSSRAPRRSTQRKFETFPGSRNCNDYNKQDIEDVFLKEFICLVFTSMPIAGYRKRFQVSVVLSLVILVSSPDIILCG